ncbi:MAG: peroxiredoxin [Alphaproteobacteria bacterium]|jgi:peroxiredoxin Q/BCP|nr:peroxiredoxin [Alphaproteobacteria bacterium]MDP6237400.1 peroxiredoxin [Alphaproteobacteria bacterium]MDP7173724.1 peroxiredoxin [Alphaproteobacteria bacterium]MDP7234962.1 peroxiredoxin [Alphaproteobacteria bacterium]MDP7487573.1 peroxiredoxin [Alphaproteobacteria bacterium]|tara:strand:+ start:99 stop:569 length:471 start_codon:yes stop_codon:yes gene_type:complete
MSDKVSVGDEAPEFALPASGSEDISLAYFKGKTLVLYFYPKDDTAGCTKEAIAFTEHVGAFEAAGVSVIGASKDSVSNHDKFIAKHDLGVRLISDEDGTLCEDYGVWVQKSMYGRKYMGIERSTFVIDGNGIIRAAWRKVKMPGHVEEVLAAVRDL